MNFLRVVIIFLVSLSLSSCDWIGFRKMQTYSFSVDVGNPDLYPVIYDWSESYLYDADQEVVLYFGGMIGTGGGWGDGAQNTPLTGEYSLPRGVHVKWYSIAEDEFWEGDFKFDDIKIFQMFEEGFTYFSQKKSKEKYSTFVVNAVPGGKVAIWLMGGGEMILLGMYQANKVQTDWNDFAKASIGYDIDRKEFRDLYLRDEVGSGLYGSKLELSDSDFENYLRNIPKDAVFWTDLLQEYPYKFTMQEPFKLVGYRAWYLNGESLSSYSKKMIESKSLPVPYRIYLVFTLPSGEDEAIEIYLDKDSVQKQFNQFFKSKDVNAVLQFELKEDLSEGFLYLVNTNGQKLKLEIEEVYLTDID